MATAARRRKIVAGNWKMNKTVPEALALVRELRGLVAPLGDTVEVVLAPTFVALQPLHVVAEGVHVPAVDLLPRRRDDADRLQPLALGQPRTQLLPGRGRVSAGQG